jgi:hypothetical protein
VPDQTFTEIRDLLEEIRDLLRPVADAHIDAYEERRRHREEERLAQIQGLLSTPKREKAWELADGSRSQREIAKEAGMDEGGASRFFKALRDQGAIADIPNPTRTVEVK